MKVAPVTHTSCQHCDLDIEGVSPYAYGEWRDRGNNTHCAGGRKHEPPAGWQPAALPAAPRQTRLQEIKIERDAARRESDAYHNALFDVMAGFVPRAPKLMQEAGLEWAWRLAMEPRKLFKRYIKTNSAFLALLGMRLADQRIFRRTRRPKQAK